MKKILFAAACAASVLAQAKDCITLLSGSDWCVSGRDVRKVFESAEFAAALRGDAEIAVFDDMENPVPAVESANAALKGRMAQSTRYPAVSCVSGGQARLWALFENLPRDITAKTLAARVREARARRDEALQLFKEGAALRGKDDRLAADAYGRAFELLAFQCGENGIEALKSGELGYKEEWKALAALDAGDRYGWTMRFTMGDGVKLVERATEFRKKGDFAGGAKFIEGLRKIPQTHFTPEQRQCIDIAEYALWRLDPSRAASNKALLEHAFLLGRDTFWGQCAMGWLKLAGGKFEPLARYRAPVRARPAADAGASAAVPEFPLNAVKERIAGIAPTAELSEMQKLDIALFAVLRRIGREGWNALHARPGADKFAKEFFSNRTWLEDFAWSGPGDWRQAVLALESIVFQDDGRWIAGDGAGRRCATAMALECSGRDEAWLADYFDAFRETAREGRLHAHALSQGVWQWRFALQQSHAQSHSDDPASQQRFMQKFVNLPARKYGNAHWNVPYRSFNCFGESVHSSVYYRPWREAGDWPQRRYSHIVGGVCGELSKFGTACSNSHGLPATTTGQPGHCAYCRRLPGGKWEIDNSVDFPTDMHLSMWPGRHWSYVQAHEGTFEGDRERRLGADRFCELAVLAAERKTAPDGIEQFYKRACAAWPAHFNAWLAYGEWLRGSGCTLEKDRAWTVAAANALKGWRHPLWDLASPYFKRFAVEKGAKALADEIIAMLPLFRQAQDALQEEGRFDKALAAWSKPLASDEAAMARITEAALAAQQGTRDYMSQVLFFGCKALMKTQTGSAAYMKMLEKFSSGGKDRTGGLDFGPLLLGASQAGNLQAFRQIAALQNAIEPVDPKCARHPANDFGGALLSGDGMLRTSSTCSSDSPRNYARGISAAATPGRAFTTDWESKPWATVTLPGAADVTGVVAIDKTKNGGRQLPLEILVSEDGTNWRSVGAFTKRREVYRLDLSAAPVRASHVMVRRKPGAKSERFSCDKILVYGRKLY